MPFSDIENLELGPLYGFLVDSSFATDPALQVNYPPISVALSNYDPGPFGDQAYVITEFGLSEGGVTITIEQENAELMSDQYGTNVLDYVIIKRQSTVTYPMAEEIWEVVADIMPNVDYSGPTSDDYMALGIATGTSTRTFATSDSKKRGFLGVRVVGGAISTDAHDQVWIPLIAITSGWELSYTKDTQRVRELTIQGLYDPSFDVIVFGDWAAYGW